MWSQLAKRVIAPCGLLYLLLRVMTAWPVMGQAPCTGNCDNGPAVTIDEVVRGVNLALDRGDVASCLAFDADANGRVSIDEIIAAVSNLLYGCGVRPPTPLTTATPTPHPTLTVRPTTVAPTPTFTRMQPTPQLWNVTILEDGGTGSLRHAVENAQAGDRIQIGATGVIRLGGSPLVVQRSLTIEGPGAGLLTVSGNGESRVFVIASGMDVTISGLTIADGVVDDDQPLDGLGGGIFNGVGAGVFNSGRLTLIDCVVRGNRALNQPGCDPGLCGSAGIFNGALGATPTLRLERCTVRDNDAGHGASGGVGHGGQFAALIDSTVADNRAGAGGGGIGGTGGMMIVNSTISGNSATSGGGIAFAGRLTLINATVTANRGTVGTGGGLTSTCYRQSCGVTVLRNSIIGANLGGDCFTQSPASTASQGGNLDGDGSCHLGEESDQPAAGNVRLGPLAANGGPTQTHALRSGSPAIDAVPAENCTDDNGQPLITDQRGLPRPVGAGCDSGAVEVAR